jgi:metal-responsive CopG/Arc/MetJ family transcriptional regulator
MSQNVYSKDVILSAVHNSLSGEAVWVIVLVGEHAELPQIIAKLDSIYGVIDDKTDVMTDFYNAKQMSDENVATWSCRL